MKNIVICETWTETERGWGTRPDGASLHLSEDDYKKYIQEYWDGMPKETPHEYSRPDDNLKKIHVSDKVYKQVCKSKNGLRLWKWEYNDLLKDKKTKMI